MAITTTRCSTRVFSPAMTPGPAGKSMANNGSVRRPRRYALAAGREWQVVSFKRRWGHVYRSGRRRVQVVGEKQPRRDDHGDSGGGPGKLDYPHRVASLPHRKKVRCGILKMRLNVPPEQI